MNLAASQDLDISFQDIQQYLSDNFLASKDATEVMSFSHSALFKPPQTIITVVLEIFVNFELWTDTHVVERTGPLGPALNMGPKVNGTHLLWMLLEQ